MIKEISVIGIVPFVLFISGLVLHIKPPKRINSFYGFRTRSASRSQHTWTYANKKGALLFMMFGIIILFIHLVLYYFMIYALHNEDVLKTLAEFSIIDMIIACVFTVSYVQYKLKKLFDDNGQPR